MECLKCLHCNSLALKRDEDGLFCVSLCFCDIKGCIEYAVSGCTEYEDL